MRRPLLVIAAYALLALLMIPVYPHFPSPNELSRWLLDASIVEHGTIEVTRLAPLLGARFEDLAVVGGRMYSNKAPGTNLFSLLGYAIARIFTTSLRPLLTAERLAASTLPLLVLALLFVRLGRRWSADERRVTVVVWTLLFATPLFAYGLLLFSHALVAAALFGAWYCLHEERRDVFAGALIGVAVSAEYPMAIPAAILVAPVIRTRRAIAVIAGGAPFAIALAAYHAAAFGGPLRNPYSFSKLQAYRDLATGGLLGIHAPSPAALVKLLFDPVYGLLMFAPVLVLGVPALIYARRRLQPAAWWTLILAPLAILLIYAGYPYWHGGWNVGPRYLVPMIPFLVAPMILAPGIRIIEPALGGASTVAIALTTLVFPFVPRAFAIPWMSLAAPLLGQGLVAPNLLHLVHPQLAIAIPFGIVAIAAAVAHGKEIAYASIGVLLVLSVGFRPPDAAQRWQRAYIAEVYFERKGSLPEDAPEGLLGRRALELTLPPASWPFD